MGRGIYQASGRLDRIVEVIVSIQRIAVRAFQVAAFSGIVFGAIAPTAAHASCYPAGANCTPSDPGGTTTVAGNTATKASTLPFTGGDVAGMAVIGAGAVLAGTVLVRQSRRRVTV